MKGKNNTDFRKESRWENEKSKSYEERIQNQFGGFCTRVLKNEAKYLYRELSNQAVKEKVFDELSDKELSELAVYDNY